MNQTTTAVATAYLLFLVLAVSACQPGPERSAVKTITTAGGDISGVASPFDTSINVYRGIPYAAPPVGERRFQPPQPALPWTGTRVADTFPNSCYQARHTSTFVWRREDFAVSEDCLYLNVWSPDGAQAAPVMVWFHGGAHTSGQGHSTIFDGTRLARSGVVLVTINYRLGPFGFLAHDWLADESDQGAAGNYGLMDKIAALQWVRDNIAGFGGDPGNVTVFGQSAGSQSVCSLMASTLADNLFHKAIGQSAACFGPTPRDADGRERGDALVREAGAGNLDSLRSLPAEKILAAAESSGWANQSRIVIDGYVLTESQEATFARGEQASIPLLAGSLSNEGIELIPRNDALSEQRFLGWQERTFGQAADQVARHYQALSSPGEKQHAMATDMFMDFGMRRWAEYQARSGQPTYLYYMDHEPPAFHLYMPESPVLELPGGPRSAGAYHSGDLAYVFGSHDKVGVDWTAQDRAMSETIVNYWTNFARTGSPNGEGVPAWPAFTLDDYSTQYLGHPVSSLAGGNKRELLDDMARVMPLRDR